MTELLSIAIPTRNRSCYLDELLQSLHKQIEADDTMRHDARIHIFDNASTDNTTEIVFKYKNNIYHRNVRNIGGDENILKAYTHVSGQYVWVIGDDELVPQNTIRYILDKIHTYNLHLFINNSHGYRPFIKLPRLFPCYLDFARFVEKHNPHLLIAHSLISANVIHRSCFDDKFARKMINSHYGHMYGMMKGLKEYPGGVFLPEIETLTVRTERAAPVDGIWPDSLDRDQEDYLAWLASEYGLRKIIPNRVVPDYIGKLERFGEKVITIRGFVRLLYKLYSEIYARVAVFRSVIRFAKRIYIRISTRRQKV